MQRRINPFNELYVTESISSSQFVKIFSPALIENFEPLFLPGNVILSGVQGSGKSMLLELLKPDVRIAYSQLGVNYPVESVSSRFISAGINLIRSRAIDFGQRPMDDDPEKQTQVAPLFFADFLNHWLVLDILRSIDKLSTGPGIATGQHLGLKADIKHLNHFAESLALSDAWLGSLKDIRTWKALQESLEGRISAYFSFLNFNRDSLPEGYESTKTRIGEPVSAAANVLKSSEVTPSDVHIFLQIDQYEELCRLEGLYTKFGPLYRRIVNKALGLRSPSVSYRIGTRGYALDDDLYIYGTDAKLESDRNYKHLDLDVLLRRPENPRSWIFPTFAADVFTKRLTLAAYEGLRNEKTIYDAFGVGPSPAERACILAGKTPEQAVKVENNWSPLLVERLNQLAKENPLEGRLSEAWIRQKYASEAAAVSEDAAILGWKKKPWWKKERTEQALIQIAGRCRRQRMVWSGVDDVLQLSGGNILVFVSICQHIWGAWLRSAPAAEGPQHITKIDDDIQALGIHEASTHSFHKIPEERDGNTRQRFVSYVANVLERKMISDLAMSYPGHNGFSVALHELEQDLATKKFLEDAVDYGALFDSPHTTKSNDRKPRMKYYLNPILTPHFRLPHIRTKEPYYITVSDVRKWILAATDGSDPNIVPEQSSSPQEAFLWPGGTE